MGICQSVQAGKTSNDRMGGIKERAMLEMMVRRTGQLDRLHEIVEYELGEYGETVVVLEEGKCWLGRVGRVRCLCEPCHQSRQSLLRIGECERRTRMFFRATNTLGAETTAIFLSAVAPSRSCLARRFAVSSEYYWQQMNLAFSRLLFSSMLDDAHPEL